MEKRKVLWLCSWYPDRIQTQNGDFIQRQARATAAFVDVVTVHVAPDGKMSARLPFQKVTELSPNLTEHILYYPKKRNGFFAKLQSVYRYFRVYKTFVEDYINANGIPDVVHVNVAMRDGLIALWMKRKYKIPYVVTEHWNLFYEDNGNLYRKRNFLFKYFSRNVFKHASVVLPVTSYLGKAIDQYVSPIKFVPVPNVVDTSCFYEEDATLDPFTFIHISTLNAKKKAEGIVQAFHRFYIQNPNSRLIIIGGGSIEDFEEWIKVNGLLADGVDYRGILTYSETAAILRKSQVFILNSTVETFSCVVAEALCCGLPVISTNLGISGEVIVDGVGKIIPFNDAEALYQAMLHIYQHYNSYDKRKNAAFFSEMFKYGTVGRQIADIYEEVLQSHAASQ